MIGRRAVLRALATLPLAALATRSPGAPRMHTRAIPSTGEQLPVIGLGTWQTFDVGEEPSAREPLRRVLSQLLEGGGRVVDSSPMYGRSEAVVGELLRELPQLAPRAFVATKVWTSGQAEGEAQMAESERRMGGRIDLLQVHNLVDWRTHLPTLRAWKAAGRIRYVGVTHYRTRAFEELEQIVRSREVDFVQLPYSVATTDAEARLLPAAQDAGVAVLVMRPFEEGELFRRARGKPLPGVARELQATSWAQLFLKFIVAHPAVTCAIPATSKPAHLAENLRAGAGRLPDAAQRRAIRAALDLA